MKASAIAPSVPRLISFELQADHCIERRTRQIPSIWSNGGIPISNSIDPRTLRREPRAPVAAGTIVEVTWYDQVLRGIVIDRSPRGMLLEFDHPPTFPIGELIVLDLVATQSSFEPLPYLGVGCIARIENNRMGINLDLSHLVELDPATADRTPLLQAIG